MPRRRNISYSPAQKHVLEQLSQEQMLALRKNLDALLEALLRS